MDLAQDDGVPILNPAYKCLLGSVVLSARGTDINEHETRPLYEFLKKIKYVGSHSVV